MIKNKMMAIVMGAMIIASSITTISHANSEDDLYKSAYNSMVVAQKERTQVSINKARVAINALPVNMVSQRGTLSSEVDKVQQPIFVKIIDTIMEARRTPSQSKINEGQALLVGVEPAYKNSWSSALDEVQNVLITRAINNVNTTIASDTESNRVATQNSLNELATSTNGDVSNFVKILKDNLQNKKPIEVAKPNPQPSNANAYEVKESIARTGLMKPDRYGCLSYGGDNGRNAETGFGVTNESKCSFSINSDSQGAKNAFMAGLKCIIPSGESKIFDTVYAEQTYFGSFDGWKVEVVMYPDGAAVMFTK